MTACPFRLLPTPSRWGVTILSDALPSPSVCITVVNWGPGTELGRSLEGVTGSQITDCITIGYVPHMAARVVSSIPRPGYFQLLNRQHNTEQKMCKAGRRS